MLFMVSMGSGMNGPRRGSPVVCFGGEGSSVNPPTP